MAESPERPDVTLDTLHQDLTAGFGEMRAGFADLKTTLIAGFRSLPSRESSEEMVRLLRESHRLQAERFAQLDVRIREQHLEVQQILRTLAENQQRVVETQQRLVQGQQSLLDGQQLLFEGQRLLSADIRALIARIDALIRDRGDGNPAA
jgi:hypothetical protein